MHRSDKLILAFSPADFVGADGGDPAEITMFEPPCVRHFHRAKDTVPTGFEDFRHFFPAQPLTQGDQKPGIGYRELIFPRCPRQLFDLDATGWALHPSWGIEEEDWYAHRGTKAKLLTRRASYPGRRSSHLEQIGLPRIWGCKFITKVGGPGSRHLQES